MEANEADDGFKEWFRKQLGTKSPGGRRFTHEAFAAALLAASRKHNIKAGITVKAVGHWASGERQPGANARKLIALVLGNGCTREEIDRRLNVDDRAATKDARVEIRALEARIAECERVAAEARAEAEELRAAQDRRINDEDVRAFFRRRLRQKRATRVEEAEAHLWAEVQRLIDDSGGRAEETMEALLALVVTATSGEDKGAKFAGALRSFRGLDDMTARAAVLDAFAAAAAMADGLTLRTAKRATEKPATGQRDRRVTLTSRYGIPRLPTPEEERLGRASTVWKREAAASFRQFEADMTWLLQPGRNIGQWVTSASARTGEVPPEGSE